MATESEVIRITACKQTCRKQRNIDSHGERERERESERESDGESESEGESDRE